MTRQCSSCGGFCGDVCQRENVTQLDKSGTVAVDQEYFWRPMATCPLGVKVQLLGAGGVALYGQYNGREAFYKGWAPLPKKPKEMQ